MPDLINSNNCIGDGLPASVMRESMENKNLLANKGSIYVGTGGNHSFTINDNTYVLANTSALEHGSPGTILRYTDDANSPTGFEQIDPATTEDFIANKADKATDSTYATKIGTSSEQSSIGSDTNPVYINSSGYVVACGTYANASKVKLNGIWKNSSTAEFYAPTSGATKGSILIANGAGQTAPGWVANGSTDGQVLRWNNSSALPEWGVSSDLAINNSVYAQKIGTNSTHPNIGDSTQPVYINTSGDVVKASTYAGGTKVTLNNTNKGASTASFYAPTASGTAGNFLVSNGNGKAPEWKSLTASKALVSDANGNISASSVNSANLAYVANVTSDIQTQINGKQATITGAATTVTSSNLTASRALVSSSSGKIAVSSTTSTELGYLSGATSNIQNQIKSISNGSTPAGALYSLSSPFEITDNPMPYGNSSSTLPYDLGPYFDFTNKKFYYFEIKIYYTETGSTTEPEIISIGVVEMPYDDSTTLNKFFDVPTSRKVYPGEAAFQKWRLSIIKNSSSASSTYAVRVYPSSSSKPSWFDHASLTFVALY